MNLNKMMSKAGSVIVTVTVFLFALFLIVDFSMCSYFVCLILPIGFIMMTAGLHNECEGDRKVAANIGLILAAVYGTFIMLVYFSQLTTVKNEQLNEQAANLLEFGRFGLIFNYDLLGYGVMALSTFFTGLSMKSKNKTDKWLRALLMIHGVFYYPLISTVRSSPVHQPPSTTSFQPPGTAPSSFSACRPTNVEVRFQKSSALLIS